MKSLIPFLLTLFLAISFWLEGQAKDTEQAQRIVDQCGRLE